MLILSTDLSLNQIADINTTFMEAARHTAFETSRGMAMSLH